MKRLSGLYLLISLCIFAVLLWILGVFGDVKDSEMVGSVSSHTASEPSVYIPDLSDYSDSPQEGASNSIKQAGENEYIVSPDRISDHYIVVYTGNQLTAVYRKDRDGLYTELEKLFLCSTGSSRSPTREGQYCVVRRFDWRLMFDKSYGCYATTFSIKDGYLFHSVPYHEDSPNTLKNEEYEKLGTPASLGCVRLCVRDCKWIFDNIENGTQVNITHDSLETDLAPDVPELMHDELHYGWDPSDEWSEGNPYFTDFD